MKDRELEIPPDLEVSLRRYGRKSSSLSLSKIILLAPAFILGMFLARVMYAKFVIHEVSQGLDQFNSQMQATMRAQNERAWQQQLAIEQERTRRKQMEIQARQEEIQRRSAVAVEEQRKEAAWDHYFRTKRPKWCDEASTQTAMVECGNIYMRERVKFEKQWSWQQDGLVIR